MKELIYDIQLVMLITEIVVFLLLIIFTNYLHRVLSHKMYMVYSWSVLGLGVLMYFTMMVPIMIYPI